MDGVVALSRIGQALATDEVSAWDRLTFSTSLIIGIGGILVGIAGIAVALRVARRQRAAERSQYERAQAAQRERDEEQRRERAEHEAKIARRDSWRIQFEKIDRLLDQLGDIAYQISNQGPCTAAGFTALDIEGVRMRAERLAGCGIDSLKEPLLHVVTLVDRLLAAAVPDGPAPAGPELRDAYRLAVAQDRVMRELREQVSVTRDVLHGEWGR